MLHPADEDQKPKTAVQGGYVNSLDWNGGMDFWTGLLEGRGDIVRMHVQGSVVMELCFADSGCYYLRIFR